MAKTTGRIRKEQKSMSIEYDQYLAEHISNVHKGLQWMNDNLPLSKEEKEAIWEAMIMHTHDTSKYDKDEYDAYDKYFYGGNRSYKVVQDFNYAWLHHIHKNPHHWQYWVLLEDDPEGEASWKRLVQPGTGEYKAVLTNMSVMPLKIPLPYIFEMIADWWTFSWRSNNLFEIFNWYADHRGKQYIHPESRKIIERILEKIWDVLIMQETVAGRDISEIEKQYKRFWAEQEGNELVWNHPSAHVIGKVVDTRETENGLEVTVEHSGDEDALIHNPTISERKAFWGKDKPPVPTIEHSETEDDEDLYGVPELKKFPMPDKKHVKSAIRFFNYVDPKYEQELADAILERAKEYGLIFGEDITVGDDNKFKKYLPKKESQ